MGVDLANIRMFPSRRLDIRAHLLTGLSNSRGP